MKHNSSPFKWQHFEPEIILLCVRWYLRYQLSYRDLEEMMRERGFGIDHTTIYRWVQRYAPEINKRIRPHLKLAGASYRVDETYIKVGKTCKYLYRAVDSTGNTIEFMLSAKRDVSSAGRFFKKMMSTDHRRLPFTISVDKNAAYPEADEQVLGVFRCLVEQGPRRLRDLQSCGEGSRPIQASVLRTYPHSF